MNPRNKLFHQHKEREGVCFLDVICKGPLKGHIGNKTTTRA